MMIYGRVVKVISSEKLPTTKLIIHNEHNVAVDLPNEVYEQALNKNNGTLWGREIEIEQTGKKWDIRVF